MCLPCVQTRDMRTSINGMMKVKTTLECRMNLRFEHKTNLTKSFHLNNQACTMIITLLSGTSQEQTLSPFKDQFPLDTFRSVDNNVFFRIGSLA